MRRKLRNLVVRVIDLDQRERVDDLFQVLGRVRLEQNRRTLAFRLDSPDFAEAALAVKRAGLLLLLQLHFLKVSRHSFCCEFFLWHKENEELHNMPLSFWFSVTGLQHVRSTTILPGA